MTEQTSPFGGLAVAEPQTAVLPVGDGDDGATDNRRKLALAGAAAGVVVLLIAAFFLLKGGGSGNEAAALPPHIVPPATSQGDQATGTGTSTTDKPIKLPKSYSAPVGRDPFKAQYTAPVVQPPKDTSGTTTTGDSTTTTSGDVTVTTTPGGSGTGVTTVPGSTPSAAFAPVWIELVKVNGVKSATFVVGYSDGHHAKTRTFSKVAAPTDGLRTTFAGVFALLSIQDATVTLQFGDGTPFDLNKGFGGRHFVG